MKKGAGVSWFTASLLLANVVRAHAQTGGRAEIAFQGYYLSGDFNRLTDITGIAANFRTFVPGAGVVTGNIETLGGEGKFRSGNNYLELNGATWYGMRWRLTGGDFKVPTALVSSPFTNTFLPELAGEGFKIEASTPTRRYTFFDGVETLAAGPRVPFRIRVPQKVLGASVVDRIGEKLELGARAMYLSTNPDSASNYLFAPGQDFRQNRHNLKPSVVPSFRQPTVLWGGNSINYERLSGVPQCTPKPAVIYRWPHMESAQAHD